MKSGICKEKTSQHRKKFTEGLLKIDEILKALNIREGQTILDAGCGTGYMSKIFSKEVGPSGKVYALDTDKYFLQIFEKETEGTNIEVIERDITGPTDINESSVDLIYISTVIHSFSSHKMPGFLQEAARLLKPGGLLAIVEIEKKEMPFGPPLESRYTPDELKNLVSMKPAKTVQAGEYFYMQVFQNK